MDVVRVFKRVVILPPVDLHSPLSKEELLLETLRQTLTGRVEKSCYVVSIENIESFGSEYLLMDTADGSVQVSVTFRVRAVVVEPNTPAVGRLEKTDFNSFVLRGSGGSASNNITMVVQEVLDTSLLVRDLYLPVLIRGARYDQLNRAITADATFKGLYLSPSGDGRKPKVDFFRCTRPLTEVDRAELGARLAEARALAPLGATALEVGAILHPYKTQARGSDLLALIEEELRAPSDQEVFLARPIFLNFLLPEVFVLGRVPEARDRGYAVTVVDQNRGPALLSLLLHYIAYHRFGEDLERTYASRKEGKDYEALWNYFRNRKQPLPSSVGK